MKQAVLTTLMTILVLLLGCRGVANLPEPIDVEPPPVPENFQVEMPSPGVYDLYWTVEDSSSAAYFNVYIYDQFSGPAFIDSTRVMNYHYDFNFPLVGLVWGVSTVSAKNVESSIVYASAPEQ